MLLIWSIFTNNQKVNRSFDMHNEDKICSLFGTFAKQKRGLIWTKWSGIFLAHPKNVFDLLG